MAISGRAALLALIGLLPVVLLPGSATVLVWAAVVLLAILADLLLAGSPRGLRVEREPVSAVRLGEPAQPVSPAGHGLSR